MTTFTVPGTPVPQPRPRVSTRNGFARAYVPTRHPVHAYREAVVFAAAAAGLRCIEGPVELTVEAVFDRPASHLRKGGLAKGAPAYPGHRHGDCDNLAKATADALPFVDDTQVVRLIVSKRFAKNGESAHTRISIKAVSVAQEAISAA